MIAIIIKAKVCVICRSRRLRWITQTEALIIIISKFLAQDNDFPAF